MRKAQKAAQQDWLRRYEEELTRLNPEAQGRVCWNTARYLMVRYPQAPGVAASRAAASGSGGAK